MLKYTFLIVSRNKAEKPINGNPLENFLKMHFDYTSSNGKEQERVGYYNIYRILSKILIVSFKNWVVALGLVDFKLLYRL